MRFIRKLVSVIFIAVLLGITLSCNALENTARRVTKEQHYSISPNSILQSIADGRQDIFVPIETEPEIFDSSAQEWITWRQADFWNVVEALHRRGLALETEKTQSRKNAKKRGPYPKSGARCVGALSVK